MSLLNVLGLSILPISELRGGIPLGIAQGLNPILVFLVAVLSNILVIPIVFFFLDNIHGYFNKITLYRNIFDSYVERSRSKLESKIGTKTEFLALMLFVGVPLPVTGAYTGSILAWFFNINRKKAYLAVMSGVILSGVIVTSASIGLFSLF
ncbi:MAG: small multi-drug export protein [Candidatus Nanoarchaeia archaeon]|jgi:uncharacterized membrane protein|nr:small multi-drug export protein [Candidatus Nanoarchaeia archaeon]|tara:strand:- start:2793 stop:3245 length:453 start_codon:yes stop_codon:yes gene_type:complete